MRCKRYSAKEIREIQKELCKLGVLEEFTDYRISDRFLCDFLDNYEKNIGKRDYIVGSQLIPLFDRLKAEYRGVDEKEIVEKAHKLIPLIRVMFHHQKILQSIRKLRKEQGNS